MIELIKPRQMAQLGLIGSLVVFSPALLAEANTVIQNDRSVETRQSRVTPDPRQLLGQDANTPGRTSAMRSGSSTFYESLLQEVRENGSVRLRVGVSVPFAAEGLLSSSQAQVQRAEIATAQDRVAERLSTTEVSVYSSIPFMTVTVNEEDLGRLLNAPEVVTVERIKKLRPSLQQSRTVIGADLAFDRDLKGDGWNVAVLDTGVDKNHPFLQGQVIAEACFSGDMGGLADSTLCPNGQNEQLGEGAATPCDTDDDVACDHGTHVAGIVAGKPMPSGLMGVAPSAGVMAVQVFTKEPGCDGSEQSCLGAYDSDIIAALEHIYEVARHDHDIASINMSLGSGRHYSSCDYESWAMSSAINNLRSVGIPTIVASGNDGWFDSIGYPACITSAVSVGSTWDSNFTNQDGYCGYVWSHPEGQVDDVACYSNLFDNIDLLAPGSFITSSISNNQYEAWHGTSMAAPHVAACWAFIQQAVPGMSVNAVESALKTTGTSIDDWRNTFTTNDYPRVNCYDAVNALIAFEDWSCEGTCGVAALDGVVVAPPVDEPVRWVSTDNSEAYNVGLEGVGGIGSPTNGSVSLSPHFTAKKGEVIEFYFNYVTSDGAGYADFGWARVLDANSTEETLLFTARTTPDGNTVPGFAMPDPTAVITPASNEIIPGGPVWSALGLNSGSCFSQGCGYTDWVKATFTIPETGSYRLEVGVVNWDDTAFQSGLAFTMPYVGKELGSLRRRGFPAWMFINQD